jgi:hypothetical protein
LRLCFSASGVTKLLVARRAKRRAKREAMRKTDVRRLCCFARSRQMTRGDDQTLCLLLIRPRLQAPCSWNPCTIHQRGGRVSLRSITTGPIILEKSDWDGINAIAPDASPTLLLTSLEIWLKRMPRLDSLHQGAARSIRGKGQSHTNDKARFCFKVKLG